MFGLGVMVGGSLGFLLSSILTYRAIDEAWERGFQGGKKVTKIAGHIIARNDDLDEIMVEHGEDMARYKRVTNV
jgi:hypothetical protein